MSASSTTDAARRPSWADDFTLARALVVRGTGACAFIAFASLLVQVRGLVGDHGISPAAVFLSRVTERFEGARFPTLERFFALPGVHWLVGGSDAALVFMCALGMVASALAVARVLPGPMLALAYVLYLSLTAVGQIFLGYQWDMLLCESLAISLLLAPWAQLRPRISAAAPSPFALVCAWALAARLTLGSGLSKLLSGDDTWLSLTALEFHYETQPLPTPVGWLFHHLPPWFHTISCLLMFIVQLAGPLCLFVPHRALRHGAVAAMVALQLLIALTGNYTFFNLLTAILTLAAVDDVAWRALHARVSPHLGPARAALARFFARAVPDLVPRAPSGKAGAIVIAVLSVLFIALGVLAQTQRLMRRADLPEPFISALVIADPWRIAGGYGLFASMTTERNEIVIEATTDGVEWLPYALPHQPGDVDALPGFVAPHQPRLDWQMWFAALGGARQQAWFRNFVDRLLDAEPAVLALLARDPMNGERPAAVRAVFYRYRVAPFGSRRAWVREEIGLYAMPRSRAPARHERRNEPTRLSPAHEGDTASAP